jgi:sulfite oxidase
VAQHNSLQNGIWVTFEGHVYDITEFVGQHPGGDKILLAAGGAIEPFWAVYAVHQTDEVLKMLAEYRIGELKVSHKTLKYLKGCLYGDTSLCRDLMALCNL